MIKEEENNDEVGVYITKSLALIQRERFLISYKGAGLKLVLIMKINFNDQACLSQCWRLFSIIRYAFLNPQKFWKCSIRRANCSANRRRSYISCSGFSHMTTPNLNNSQSTFFINRIAQLLISKPPYNFSPSIVTKYCNRYFFLTSPCIGYW